MNESRERREPTADRRDFEALLTTVRVRVDEGLASWLKPKVATAIEVSGEVGAAAEAIEKLSLRGGKRMRAALVAAGYEACAANRGEWPVCEPALLAIELLQTYLLIHDDWMDDDDVRRGGPSVHVMLREALGSRALGDASAILAGDLSSGYAQTALLETPLPADRVLRAARAFARIQEDVVIGQLAELRGVRGAPAGGRVPTVETVHSLKTASYTVTGPLVLGALLAGADDLRAAELDRYGRPLGIAFQLRDDLLGVFGDPDATGKPRYSDIRQGKRTALVAELRGETKIEALLARTLGNAEAPKEDVEAVVAAMESTGARARVEARLRELLAESRAALDAMQGLSDTGRSWLSGAIQALGERAS